MRPEDYFKDLRTIEEVDRKIQELEAQGDVSPLIYMESYRRKTFIRSEQGN